MEFRKANPERRRDRRICPRCSWKGRDGTCRQCGAETQPRIRIIWYENGKQNKETTDAWSEREAAEILRQKERDYWRRQRLGLDRDVGGTLMEAVREFKRAKTARTSKDYRKQVDTALNTFAAGLGWDKQVHQVTEDDLIEYREEGLELRASSTVRSYLQVLRRFFAWLCKKGWIRHNPAQDVDLPPQEPRKVHIPPDKVELVLRRCWAMFSGQEAAIFTTFVLGGPRRGELVHLRHDLTDLEARWSEIRPFDGDEVAEPWRPKTKSSERQMVLHPLVVSAWRRVGVVEGLNEEPSPWVFPVVDGRRKRRCQDQRGRLHLVRGDRRSPTTTFFGRKLSTLLRDVGVSQKVTVHGLRRTFAVLLQEAGAPDSIIRQALGHKGRSVTEVSYLPRREAAVRDWVDRIEVCVPELGQAKLQSTTKIEVVEAGAMAVKRQTAPILPPADRFWGQLN